MELTFSKIQEQLDVLLKSYWLFVFSKIRTGVWEELFKQHLDEYYPENPDYHEMWANKPCSVERGKFYQIKDGKFKGNYRALETIRDVGLIDENWRRSRRGDLLLDGRTYFKEISAIRNSKRTNFPRDIWQKEELSWLRYYEGAIIVSRIYESMTIDFELVYQGKEIHKYSLPVSWALFETPDGVNIKHSGRVDNSLVLHPKHDRTYEQGLSFIVREIMRKRKLTRKQLDKLLDEFSSNPDNLHTFSTKSPPNIKSSILGTMFKWNITWSNFTRAIKVLEYTDLNISIHGVKRGRTQNQDVISTVNMRLY